MHGAETLLALEAGDAIRAAARREGCTERDVFTAEPGADWSTLGAIAANLSLFASKKLLEIRIPTGKPGAEGGKALEALCARLPEDTIVLVMLPELEWQQLKTAWFGALEDAGTVVEASAISREELPQWLAERFARQRQHASVETLEWMADRVEGNLLAAKQEVEKLALLLPGGRDLARRHPRGGDGRLALRARRPDRGDPRGRAGADRARRRLARGGGRARCRCCSGRSPRSCAS